MPENKPVYFPAIDGLRFVAFFLVFFRHFELYIPNKFLFEIGWTGVEFFFLISGFLLTKLLTLEKQRLGYINIKSFFLRRILRIWPLYFFYILIISCLSVYMLNFPLSITRLLGNIFFIDNWLSAFNQYNPNFGSLHLWSISLEEQFYLILPILAILLIKLSKKNILLFAIGSFLSLLIFRFIAIKSNVVHPFIYVLPVSGDCFLAGVIIGVGTFDDYLKKINPIIAFVSGLALLTILYFLPSRYIIDNNQLFIYPIAALAFSLILISVLFSKNRILFLLFANKPIKYLGKISYGLYIFHLAISNFIIKAFQSGQIAIDVKWSFPLALMLTIILSIISYELFEKRFLKMKRRFTRIENRKV